MTSTPLTKDLLAHYGFKTNELKTKDRITSMSKGDFELSIVDDGTIFYANIGFAYPLDTLESLKKLYREIKREDLER